MEAKYCQAGLHRWSQKASHPPFAGDHLLLPLPACEYTDHAKCGTVLGEGSGLTLVRCGGKANASAPGKENRGGGSN